MPWTIIDGEKTVTLRGPTIASDFKQLVEDYIEHRFGPAGRHTGTDEVSAPGA